MKFSRRAWVALPLSLVRLSAQGRPQASPQPIRLALVEGFSGPFANAGEAVFRNRLWATERINQHGGVRVAGEMRPLALQRFDSKGTTRKRAGDVAWRARPRLRVQFILQDNSSATAAALVDARDRGGRMHPNAGVWRMSRPDGYSAKRRNDQP